MKTLITLILLSLSVTYVGQTQKEIEMIILVNQVRTNPKSFIPVVESYIKTQDSLIQINNKPLSEKVKLPSTIVITKSTNNYLKVNNYYEERITECKRLITFLKTQKPVKPLTSCSYLYIIASSQVKYIESIKHLTHDGPNGETATKRFTKGYILCGENCAIGETPTKVLLELLIDSGVKDKGHRKNIFLKEFTLISVGNAGNYWVQDFGY